MAASLSRAQINFLELEEDEVCSWMIEPRPQLEDKPASLLKVKGNNDGTNE